MGHAHPQSGYVSKGASSDLFSGTGVPCRSYPQSPFCRCRICLLELTVLQERADVLFHAAHVPRTGQVLDATIRPHVGRKVREGGRRAKGLGLIVIDYLQLMQGRKDAGNREQEISELSRGLKALSKEMNTPVIALSQLNRAVETRSTKDKRPQLSDLRESGAIEQDADAILFIYREHYYQKDDDQARGKAEVIIAKQRNGPTGTVEVRFSDEYARFENLAREEDDIDQLDDYVDDSMSSFQM